MVKTNKTINGHEYEFMALPAMHNYTLFLKFSATVGDSLKSIFSVMDNSGFGGLGEGISLVLKSLYTNDPKGDLMLEIMSQTTRDGVAINKSTFDKFYTGNIEEMTEALTQSIIVHFKGFLPIDRLSGLLLNQGVVTTESSEV
jgi:hypothetical protein